MKTRITYIAFFFALLALSSSAFAQDLRSRDDGGPRPEENVIIGNHIEVLSNNAPSTITYNGGDGEMNNGSDIDAEAGSPEGNIDSKGLVLEIDDIKIFPNPASDYLHINFKTELTVSISLLNILGQEAYSEDVEARQVSIFVQDLQPGIYFVNIQSGEERIVRRVKISH